jgi:hypothetical protein
MAGGNEVSVSVGAGNTITVAVAGSTGTTPTITNGGTATVTVTSVGDRGPKGDVGPAGQNGSSGANGTFADAQVVNDRTASYTLAISDAGKLITASHASTAITITVPAGSAVAFPVGTHVDIARLGVAQVTVVGASGVTVNGTPGLKLRAQYSAATLIEVAADSWLLVGDLSA